MSDGVVTAASGPVVEGSALPFACVDDEGRGTHEKVVKKQAIRCSLSRICGVCGETLTRPVAFVGTPDEALDGEFAFPPCHVACARQVAADPRQRLGHAEQPHRWVLVSTAGFDLVRPARRGDPVWFRPNSVLERETL
ncbi:MULTISPECIES: hypothetical protein [Aeromicrobium]|uniref:hypothetical protein n=1 Tax=Aeromicrobium TaxID=2040 RepID=UPI000ACD3E62|nr:MULTISPECIES: hypothetical protein [Aeromicrobium]